jgi:hypothetical protein
MLAQQLELNLQNLSESELKFVDMQKQITLMSESMHKVRKKLFAEVGSLKKMLSQVQIDNENLQIKLARAEEKMGTKNGIVFDYSQKDSLFCIKEMQEAADECYSAML